MSTSNKILLTTFIAAIVIITSVNIALYAKYKKGEITRIDSSAEFDQYPLPPIKYVELKGLGSVHIYPADSFRLAMGKDSDSHLRFQVKDNTLTITGDTLLRLRQKMRSPNDNNIKMESRPVDLYLPSIEKISADFCDITLHGSKDSATAKPYVFDIAHSHLNIGSNIVRNTNVTYWNADSSMIYWKQMTLRATSSEIECAKKGRIESLDLALISSRLKDNLFIIGRLTLNMDHASSIELHGKNTDKLTTVAK